MKEKNNLEKTAETSVSEGLKNLVRIPQLYTAIGKYVIMLSSVFIFDRDTSGELMLGIGGYSGFSGVMDFVAAALRSDMPKNESLKDCFGNLPFELYFPRMIYKMYRKIKDEQK